MKKVICIFLSAFLCIGLSACLGSNKADKPYNVAINGVPITVGETKMEVLADCPYLKDLDINQMLEGNSYYSGITLAEKDGTYIGSLALYSEKDAPAKNAIIASIRVSGENINAPDITLEGTKLTDLTFEKAKELIPGAKTRDDDTVYVPGNGNYFIDVSFNKDGSFHSFEHKKQYNVDWSN